MFDSVHDDAALVDDTERVLLCLSKPRDRSLLREALSEIDVDVVVADDPDTLPVFDLCLVDTASYPAVESELQERREHPGPVLPVVLVLGPSDREVDARSVATGIDDVLTVPTSVAELQKRVESLLRTRRQSKRLALFRRAMDDADTGITIADADGDQELLYVNEAFVEMTGYDRSEVLGRNCRFLQGPETDPDTVREIRTAIDAREPVSVELRNYRKDGTMWWNSLEIAPVYDEDESVSHFVGIQQDVTERFEHEAALRQYERIVHAAGDPIYALDEDLQFTLVNESTVELANRPEDDILNSHVTSVFGTQHGQRLTSAIDHLAESGELETVIQSTVPDDAGQLRRYQTAIGVLPGDAFDGVVCVSRDITDSREREARLSVLDRVLRHNLRNKMLVILGRTESIIEADDTMTVHNAAGAIEAAAEELLDLAETARKFKRIVDPEMATTVGPIDVVNHTVHAVEEVSLEHDETDFVTDVPDVVWAAAHDSFELAVTELLYWAASSSDNVHVEVRVRPDAENDRVRISVSHDGCSLDDIERRALNAGTETELQHTSGLGLWFVRWMATNSGGSFTVSDREPGTTVDIDLPLAEPPADAQ